MYLQLFFIVAREFVLEYFAMHHVLILVDQVAAGISASLSGAAAMPEQIEFLSSISRQRVGQHQSVVGVLLHRVDISAHIQLNLKLVDLSLARNTGNYNWKIKQ